MAKQQAINEAKPATQTAPPLSEMPMSEAALGSPIVSPDALNPNSEMMRYESILVENAGLKAEITKLQATIKALEARIVPTVPPPPREPISPAKSGFLKAIVKFPNTYMQDLVVEIPKHVANKELAAKQEAAKKMGIAIDATGQPGFGSAPQVEFVQER